MGKASWKRQRQLKGQAGNAGKAVGRGMATTSPTSVGPDQQRDLEGVAVMGPESHKESSGKFLKA